MINDNDFKILSDESLYGRFYKRSKCIKILCLNKSWED